MKALCVSKRFERRKTSDGREYAHYGYAHAVKSAGVRFVEVGDGETVKRAEFEKAFSSEVGMVYWVGYAPPGDLPVGEMIEIAHDHGAKVLIDASNSLPPRENLHRFIDLGADVVIGVKLRSGPGLVRVEAEAVAPRGAGPSVLEAVTRSLEILQTSISPGAENATSILICPAFEEAPGWGLRQFSRGRRYIAAGDAAAAEALPRLAAAMPWVSAAA